MGNSCADEQWQWSISIRNGFSIIYIQVTDYSGLYVILWIYNGMFMNITAIFGYTDIILIQNCFILWSFVFNTVYNIYAF